jgi:HK97 family phage major capsid protein
MATATEGAPTAGGYLIPSPLSNAIIDVRQLAGVSRALSRVVTMTSDI